MIRATYRLSTFSLRTLFLAVSVVCVALAWGVNEGRKRNATVLALQEAGMIVEFRHRFDERGFHPNGKPPGSPLLKQILGEYYASSVYLVEGWEPELFTDREAAQVAMFDEMDWLAIQGSRITDAGLKHFGRLKSLGRLDIEGCAVSEQAVNDLSKALPNTSIFSDYGYNGP